MRKNIITIVPNEEKYWNFILEVRNHPETSSAWIQQNPIDLETHRTFMKKWGNKYFVALIDGVPAAFAGSVNGDIRIATHPNYLRCGAARALLVRLGQEFPNAVAKVKVENHDSAKLFESCGFQCKYLIYERGTPPEDFR